MSWHKSVTPSRSAWSNSFLSAVKKKRSCERAIDRQPMEPKFIPTTSWPIWEIQNRGMLSRWNHCIPPTLFPDTAGEVSVRKVKEERLFDGLFGGRGAWLNGRPRTQRAGETGTCHLECEAAGVILRDTVRWSGWPCLRSTQLCSPLIFNRCLGCQPAKSSHMPERRKSKQGPYSQLSTATQTQLLEDTHTHICSICIKSLSLNI